MVGQGKSMFGDDAYESESSQSTVYDTPKINTEQGPKKPPKKIRKNQIIQVDKKNFKTKKNQPEKKFKKVIKKISEAKDNKKPEKTPPPKKRHKFKANSCKGFY